MEQWDGEGTWVPGARSKTPTAGWPQLPQVINEKNRWTPPGPFSGVPHSAIRAKPIFSAPQCGHSDRTVDAMTLSINRRRIDDILSCGERAAQRVTQLIVQSLI